MSHGQLVWFELKSRLPPGGQVPNCSVRLLSVVEDFALDDAPNSDILREDDEEEEACFRFRHLFRTPRLRVP